MSGISDRLKEWGCEEPNEASTPEHLALYLSLSRNLISAAATDANIQAGQVAIASINELVSQAEALRHRIERSSGTKAVSTESRGRIQILNWRRHGDDESYCQVEVFGAGDTTETEVLVEKEYGVWAEAEDEGNYAATYYVNDDITIADGDIRTSHDARRFRVSVSAVD